MARELALSRKAWTGIAIIGCAILGFAATFAFPREDGVVVKPVKLIAAYPHDPQAFSQGLVVTGNELLEGTGQYGTSSLRRVELTTGRVLASVPLRNEFFGEGVTLLNGKIYQLTWKEQVCFVYDAATLQHIATYNYTGEGWGLATDGKVLYMSDGTSTIRVFDPETFKLLNRLRVHIGPRKIANLNELEFVEGELLANIWYSDHIARISPTSGEVLGWLDASHLYPAAQRPSREHVLNGIAYDAQAKRLFLTGKNWPHLFEVELPK
jgi:glutaminyl-peptide cyclotransferase